MGRSVILKNEAIARIEARAFESGDLGGDLTALDFSSVCAQAKEANALHEAARKLLAERSTLDDHDRVLFLNEVMQALASLVKERPRG